MAQADSQIAVKAHAARSPPAESMPRKRPRRTVDNLDRYLAPENKPANATER